MKTLLLLSLAAAGLTLSSCASCKSCCAKDKKADCSSCSSGACEKK